MGRPQGADGAATRRAIVDTAQRILATQGYDAMTLGAVAEQVGVSRAALYHYFPSKVELVRAVVRESTDEIDGFYDELVADDAPLSDRLRALVRACIRSSFTRQDPVLGWFQMGHLAQGDDEIAEMFKARARGVRRKLKAIVADGYDRGELDESTDAAALIEGVSGLIWCMTAGAAEAAGPASRRQLELAADSLFQSPVWERPSGPVRSGKGGTRA
jgi:AcrR family transcriptional regulator